MINGILFIHIHSLSGSPHLTPRWEISPDATGSGSGRYTTLRTGAALTATGLSIVTLNGPMRYGRLAWNLSGTTAAVKFQG